ncbi:hypothetical protein AGMMS5026_06870 [Endomicrobiia bacterium]|nr:hypothetical protein AGMMS49523_02950 [Endomicrobiia bacterium]GHT12085.1 hypothetical protein AGMMS49571_03460 [Endomicrobiia bacterium]GHT20993.1 hypothetical protein AGMMS49929_08890 [Endomicrobiia bacterium]GHT26052.1 hypothetical protein AGMMS49995_01760 [Endomicrobiia bacterium]GHT31087.1 hypothetical protein AGMMS5026_06870 [Endomicrobiia bacterium]
MDADFFINRKDIRVLKKEYEVENKLEPIRVGIVRKDLQPKRTRYNSIGLLVGGVGARTVLYKTLQGIRRLTITEAKKVMGFPVYHIVSEGVQGYRQLGNAVVPEMIGHVYDSIKVL